MKKSFWAWAWAGAAGLAASLPAVAGTGVFGSYLAVDVDGPGLAAATWFGASQPGPSVLTAFNGADLGSFVSGATATLAGAELLTWKNGTGDVTGAVLHWRVDGGSYNDLTINWTANVSNGSLVDRAGNVTSTAGNQKWANLAITNVNFLSGLPAGVHSLQVYLTAFTNEGNRDSGSAASPYAATFTVTPAVPEPGRLPLLLAGAGVLAVLVRRTRR